MEGHVVICLKGKKVFNQTTSPSSPHPSALLQWQLLRPVLLRLGAARCASQKRSEILAPAPSLLGGSWEHWDPLQGLPCAGGKVQWGQAALKQESALASLNSVRSLGDPGRADSGHRPWWGLWFLELFGVWQQDL